MSTEMLVTPEDKNPLKHPVRTQSARMAGGSVFMHDQ